MQLGNLSILPISDHLDLLALPVKDGIVNGGMLKENIGIAKIDPAFSDTASFCDHYAVPLGNTVNCVVIEVERGDKKWFAACAIFGTMRADVNGLVRRQLGARRASFASMDAALQQTGMEYGGISPIGLPVDWPLIVDSTVVSAEIIVIGSGLRGSKLIIPGNMLTSLSSVVILESVGREK